MLAEWHPWCFCWCHAAPRQAVEVERYLNLAPLPKVPFNKTGRAYPDVASIGTNYWVSPPPPVPAPPFSPRRARVPLLRSA